VSWEAIGAIADILGAIAVVATLIYLARQIRDSARATSVETERDISEAWNQTLAELGQNEEIAAILAKGLKNYRALSQPEKAIFHTRMGRVLNHNYTQYRMRENGFGDPVFADNMDRVAMMVLKSPGGAQWWEDVGPSWAHYEYVQGLREKYRDVRPLSDLSFMKSD